MQALLMGASILSILLAIIMTVVASKVLRENRARSAARIAALQALVDATPPTAGPALMSVEVSAPDLGEEPWDLDLRETYSDELPPFAHAEVQTPRFSTISRRPEPTDVRTSNFELRTSLFEDPVPRTPVRRWPWMAAAGLLMASIAGMFLVISSGVVGRVAAANNAKTIAASASPMELLSLRHSIDTSGNFIVTGLVQNPATSAPLRSVVAVVYLFDAEGRYFASGHAALESAVLSPGGEAAFTVRVPASTSSSSPMDVSRYRVSFQQEDGVAVNHVDRRGTLPDQTTGDTVQTPAPTAPSVTARRD